MGGVLNEAGFAKLSSAQTKHHSGPPALSPAASASHHASFESATAAAVLTLNEMAEASWWAPPACSCLKKILPRSEVSSR